MPKRVVVVPEGGGRLGIGILERGRSPAHPARPRSGPTSSRAWRIPGRDVDGVRQIPGLGIAVAHTIDVGAVHVRHHWDRPRVRGGIGPHGIRHPRPGCGISPVDGLIHRKQMGKIITVPIDQAVDPLHARGRVRGGLDGERREIERPRMIDRPVSPDGGLVVTGRKYLLLELPHRYLVVPRARARHLRRDHQWRHEFRDTRRVEGPTRDGLRERGRRHQNTQHKTHSRDSYCSLPHPQLLSSPTRLQPHFATPYLDLPRSSGPYTLEIAGFPSHRGFKPAMHG